MSAPATYKYDGVFTTPMEEGSPRPRFPFANTPAADVYARIIERDFKIRSDYFDSTRRLTTRTSYTNQLTYSEDFSNAAWTKDNVTRTGAALANPWDGQSTFSKFLETVDAGFHRIYHTPTYTAVATTVSALVAGGLGRTYLYLRANDGTTTFGAFFDISTGQVFGTPSNCTAAIKRYIDPAGNITFKLAITFTPLASGGYVDLMASTNGSTTTYSGDTAKGFYCGGIQIERASSAGPYIVTTSSARTISAPDIDATTNPDSALADYFAWLVAEYDPLPTGLAYLAGFTRVYARIPAQQVNASPAQLIPLPTPANTYNAVASLSAADFEYNQTLGEGHFQGGSLYTTFDSKLYQGKRVTASVSGRATGGTFTITYGANTTAALNWNDSAGTIATAINGLASVIADGITVSIANDLASTGVLGITLTLTSIPSGWPKKFTATVSSLTVTTSKNAATSVVTGNAQIIYLADHLTISSHGFDTAQRLACVTTGNYLTGLPSGYWGSIDSNTIWVPTAGSSSWAIAGDYKRTYTPGSRLLRTRLKESFYLPGVTTGITTDSDITPPDGLEQPDAMLAALVSATGWQDYSSDGPASWQGPILRLATTQINFSDI